MHFSMVVLALIAAVHLASSLVIGSSRPALNVTEISAILSSLGPVITAEPSLAARMMSSEWMPTGDNAPPTGTSTGPLDGVPTIDILAINPDWKPPNRHLGHGPAVHGPRIQLDQRVTERDNITSPFFAPTYFLESLSTIVQEVLGPIIRYFSTQMTTPKAQAISPTRPFLNSTATRNETMGTPEKRADGPVTIYMYPDMTPGATAKPKPTETEILHILPRRGRYRRVPGKPACVSVERPCDGE